MHACNPTLRRLRKEDHKFEVILGYIVRLFQKTKKHTACTFDHENSDLHLYTFKLLLLE
jgi:hypothetical protein